MLSQSGKKPQITGVTTIDPNSWKQVSDSGIYYKTTARPYGVFEDGVKIIDDAKAAFQIKLIDDPELTADD